MTSRQAAAPSYLRTNYKHGNTALYGVSTQDEEAAGRRVCMSGLPHETKTDDILDFFNQGAVEGITIRYGHSTLAFVQFARPSDFTEALLKNFQPFLNTRALIRPYKKGAHPSPQSGAKRRSLAAREQSESTTMHGSSTKRSPPSRYRNRSSEQTTRETPPPSNRNRSRSPDTAKSPTGSRISERSSSYHRTARSPPSRRRSRSRSPSSRGHAHARSPERSSHSERSKRYDRSRRSPERARTRSTSSDRDRHKRVRDRSPSLDRNFSRRPDPFLSNDLPNPSKEMLVQQSLALWNQQPQVPARIPMAHVFGANSAPLPNLPGAGMTQAIAYTTQASQSSYVAHSSGGGVGGGLFNGHLDRIFTQQAQSRAQQLQATSNGIGGATAAPEMPAGVELILKLILEHKSARHLSMFQLDSVVKYLQEQKRIIQEENVAGDQSRAVNAIEAPPSVAVDTAGDVRAGSSDDLRNRLNQQQSDESVFEIARKIKKYHGSNIKEEKE